MNSKAWRNDFDDCIMPVQVGRRSSERTSDWLSGKVVLRGLRFGVIGISTEIIVILWKN